jgi:hypothetical protein
MSTTCAPAPNAMGCNRLLNGWIHEAVVLVTRHRLHPPGFCGSSVETMTRMLRPRAS